MFLNCALTHETSTYRDQTFTPPESWNIYCSQTAKSESKMQNDLITFFGLFGQCHAFLTKLHV